MYEPGTSFFFFASSAYWDTLTTFASHTFMYLMMYWPELLLWKATGLLFCIPGHLRAGTFGWLDFVDLTFEF